MAEISKEMYRCRLQIDEVLTPEQIKEFRNSLEAERKKQIKNKQTRMRLDEKHKISVKNNTEKE
jgi:Spy/CpxP family protein refolding chaperone